MRIFLKILFSSFGIILLFILTINFLGTRADIVIGVSGSKIKQVKPGLTLEEVISILGRPYKIDAPKGLHDIGCPNPKPLLKMDINNTTDIRQVVDAFYNDTNYCCDGNKEDLKTKELTLTYTRPITFSKHYPMLWVHLDSSYKVYSVYAKQYDGLLGLDDPGIYGLSWKLDPITMKLKNETESFIDESKFNDCFK